MAAASTCYANVTCLSAAAAHRHTQRYGLSVCSGGQAETDASSHTQMYILSDILTLAVFSVDTLDRLDS